MVKLVIIRGPPASGKSSISVDLVKGLKGNWVVVPKDAINSRFYLSNRNKYGPNEILWAIVKDCLSRKINILLEGVFGGKDSKKVIKRFETLAGKLNAKFYVITLNTDIGISYKRNRKREKTLSKSEIDKWHKYFYENLVKKGLVLDNDNLTKKEAIIEIKKYLQG